MGADRKTDKPPLSNRIGRQARRKRAHQRSGLKPLWFGLGMFGMVGWSIALPTLLGAALGSWLDKRWPGEVSWTLSLILIGLALGCLNAWYWIKQENDNHD